MDERRWRSILQDELAASEARQRMFLRGLGIDVDNPREQIADNIHLRRWRKLVDSTGVRAVSAVVVLMLTGILSLIWSSFLNLWRH